MEEEKAPQEQGENSLENSEERKMFKAVCSECGKDCEVPFEPEEGKSVKCKECYIKNRPRRFNRNRRFDRGPRKMHSAKCGKCGKNCEVPFEPKGDKPVLCQECYRESKGFA